MTGAGAAGGTPRSPGAGGAGAGRAGARRSGRAPHSRVARISTKAGLAALSGGAFLSLWLAGCSATSVLSLQTGQCLDSPSGESVTEVTVRDCDSPHGVEVIGTVDLTGGDLPAEDELVRTAQEQCTQIFADYVGVPVEQSDLSLTWLAPTSQSWSTSGDRTITCLAGSDNTPLTGTVKGSNR